MRAVAKVHGPAALDEAGGADHDTLAVRADLLAGLGRHAEASTMLREAAALTRNDAERAHLEAKAAAYESWDERDR